MNVMMQLVVLELNFGDFVTILVDGSHVLMKSIDKLILKGRENELITSIIVIDNTYWRCNKFCLN